ncbi:MAG: hypothetical protein EXR93_08675 [Gemmatimonadetes bacterium]|nr:hypothetical protein [Gemmatimonadota bacterium]
MSFFRTRLGVALATLATVSCAAAGAYMWRDSDFSALPIDGLAGAPVMVLPLLELAADPGAIGSEDLSYAQRLRVDSVIASGLHRRVPYVPWMDAVTVRERAEADRSLPHPDSLATSKLRLRALMGVPSDLLEQLRRLVTINHGRYVLMPARMTFKATKTGRARAEFTVILVDTKVGAIAWKSDAWGSDDTAFNAVTAAIFVLTPPKGR